MNTEEDVPPEQVRRAHGAEAGEAEGWGAVKEGPRIAGKQIFSLE